MTDDKDELLLSELGRNARASVVDLARRIGLSRSATQERLARLQRDGVIAGYSVIRGDGAAGRSHRLRAWLLIEYGGKGGCASLIPRLRRISGTGAIYALAGNPDLMVEVTASTAAGMDAARGAVAALDGVAAVSTHMVLAAHGAPVED